MKDDGFLYSAAVSFYTLFSLAPVAMIAVYLGGFFAGNENVLQKLTQFLTEAFGRDSADAVLLLIQTIQTDTRNILYLAISIGFLLISATTVFVQLKNSFNRIFTVRPKSEVGILKVVIDRLVAFGMIVLLGFALVMSLVLDTFLSVLSDVLLNSFQSAQVFIAGVGTNILTILMILFTVIVLFYFLPDVKIRRKPLFAGSIMTSLLLIAGKFGVEMIVRNSSLNNLSGASSSVIILMLWVYYSCIIIFFGIELVKALAEAWEGEIKANKYAVKQKMVEVISRTEEQETE
jgi:membrane protein